MYVERRGEKHVCTIFKHFFSDCIADLLHQLLVPCGCKESPDREVSAIVGGFVPFAHRIDAQSCRAVCENYCGYAQARNRICGSGCSRYEVPGLSDDRGVSACSSHAGSDDKMGLLLEGHGSDYLVDGCLSELRVSFWTA